MPLFLFGDDGKNAARFIGTLAVYEVAQDRHRQKTEQRNGDDADDVRLRRRLTADDKLDQTEQRIGDKYRRGQGVIACRQHLFRAGARSVECRLPFITFLIDVAYHEFSISHREKICKSLREFSHKGIAKPRTSILLRRSKNFKRKILLGKSEVAAIEKSHPNFFLKIFSRSLSSSLVAR